MADFEDLAESLRTHFCPKCGRSFECQYDKDENWCDCPGENYSSEKHPWCDDCVDLYVAEQEKERKEEEEERSEDDED